MGDCEKKFLQALVEREKLQAAQMDFNTFLHCCQKEKKNENVTKLFRHSERFTKSQRNWNHSSLAPF